MMLSLAYFLKGVFSHIFLNNNIHFLNFFVYLYFVDDYRNKLFQFQLLIPSDIFLFSVPYMSGIIVIWCVGVCFTTETV